MAQKMVHLRGVGVQYSPSRYALRDVSFDLGRGEFAYITGANGAGKTTLVKMLLAEEKPTTGSVFFESINVHEVPMSRINRVQHGSTTVVKQGYAYSFNIECFILKI
jgi:cell division transport system ATP-binding protein